MSYKQQILELRKQGLSYKQISKKIGCAKSTVTYHCGKGQREKSIARTYKRRQKISPLHRKIEYFLYTSRKYADKHKSQATIRLTIKYRIRHFTGETSMPFSVDDVLQKIGDNPTCYLTGQPIDLSKPSTYQLDHITPRSRGGTNDLDNLGLCTKNANQAKKDMTPDELINLCKVILQHQGYTVTK